MNDISKSTSYNDLWLRIVVAVVAAHIIISFGATESFWQLLISWYYYRDMSLSFLIAFLLVNEVYLFTIRLDRLFDWKLFTAQRIGLQLLLGIIVPSITAFLLADGYFAIFGIQILKTHYLEFDFPVIVIMILLLNVYYLAFYFFKQWKITEQRIAALPTEHKKELTPSTEVFVIQKGAKNIPLPVDNISYFFHEGDYNFVRTIEKEDFMVNQALDDVEAQLHTRKFFRINRQLIANIKACKHYEPAEYGKLKVILCPPTKEPVIISQKRAKQFKEWIAQSA